MLSRRDWVRLTLSGAAATVVARVLPAQTSPSAATKLTVYKSPTCGCCRAWVDHMKSKGFTVETHDMPDDKLSEVKDTFGVPAGLRSCHVALLGKYVLEGHVPADLAQRLLTEKPKLVGLAVPGMPAGSPGMEMGSRKDRYDVVAFAAGGKHWTYASR
jgi:hypothetical protein